MTEHNKRALLIGINDYKYVGKLKGCVNDADLMAHTLKERFNFPADNIIRLSNEEATRDNILSELNALEANIQHDDIVLLFYAGHGSFMTDMEQDEPDGYDETIVPVDSAHHKNGVNTDIRDDELFDWITRITQKTSNLTLIFDCCHSGSAVRDTAGGLDRQCEPDLRPIEELKALGVKPAAVSSAGQARGAGGWLPHTEKYVLLAGCLDKETSKEINFQGKRHGLFSYNLCAELEKITEPGTTYLDVFERVAQQVTAKNGNQHPQIEGTVNREVFGVTDITPMSYVRVGQVFDLEAGKGVKLEAGMIHGVTEGTTWKIYSQGTKHTETARPLGRMKTVQVDSTFCYATALPAEEDENHEAIAVGDRAVVLTRSYADLSLKINVDVADTWQAQAQAVQTAVSDQGLDGLIQFVDGDKADEADLHIKVISPRTEAKPGDVVPQLTGTISSPKWAVIQDGKLAMPIHNVDGRCACSRRVKEGPFTVEKPLHDETEAAIIELMVENLKKIAQFRHVSTLQNPNLDSDLARMFEMKIMRSQGDKWVEVEVDSTGRAVIDEGTRVMLHIENKSKENVFINVLNLGITKRIAHIFPEGNRKGEEMLHERSFELKGNTGKGYQLVFPDDFPFVQDPADEEAQTGEGGFLLLVTPNQTDVTGLLQDGMRSVLAGSQNPLENLLGMVGTGVGTRDVAEESMEDWTTVIKKYLLRPRQE